MKEKKYYIYYDIDRLPGDPAVRVKKYVDTSIEVPVQKYALGMFSISEELFLPGGGIENGSQPYYECCCIVSGELEIRCGKEKKLLKKGDMFLIHPHQNFFLKNAGKENAARRSVFIHPGPVAGLLLDHGILAETLFPSLTEAERVYEYFSSLQKACEEQNEYTLHLVSSLCYSLITEIARQCEWHDKSSEFKRITFLMARLPARKYTTTTLAADCGVSVRTLYNLFKKEKNCSPIEYLIHLRMSLAKWYFLREDLAISDVANLCGYNNIPFFTREFKKHTGMTPGAWIKEHKNRKNKS